MPTIRFGSLNGTRAEIRQQGHAIKYLNSWGWGRGQKGGRRSMDDSLIFSKPFSYLWLYSQIMP